MNEEFELTYLGNKEILKKMKGCPMKEMLDIYIPSGAKHPNLRIRKKGDKYEITKKQPIVDGDSSHQMENTIPLTKEEFDELAQIPGKRTVKDRYIYKEGEYVYEIDVFKEDLEGLILVDVEFRSNEEKAKFMPPAWVSAEVTQEEFTAGGMLCGKTFEEISDKLDKFGYAKVKI